MDDINLAEIILNWAGIPLWFFFSVMLILFFFNFPRFMFSILSLLFAYYIYWGMSLEKKIIGLFEYRAVMPISEVLTQLGLSEEDRKDCKPLSWGPGPICKVYDSLDKLLNERQLVLSNGSNTAIKKEQVLMLAQ